MITCLIACTSLTPVDASETSFTNLVAIVEVVGRMEKLLERVYISSMDNPYDCLHFTKQNRDEEKAGY